MQSWQCLDLTSMSCGIQSKHSNSICKSRLTLINKLDLTQKYRKSMLTSAKTHFLAFDYYTHSNNS